MVNEDTIQEIIKLIHEKIRFMEDSGTVEVEYFDSQNILHQVEMEIDGRLNENIIDHAVESSIFKVTDFDITSAKSLYEWEVIRDFSIQLTQSFRKSII